VAGGSNDRAKACGQCQRDDDGPPMEGKLKFQRLLFAALVPRADTKMRREDEVRHAAFHRSFCRRQDGFIIWIVGQAALTGVTKLRKSSKTRQSARESRMMFSAKIEAVAYFYQKEEDNSLTLSETTRLISLDGLFVDSRPARP